MPYCIEDDLLLGDLTLPAGFDTEKWIVMASDEMDSKLGYVYVLPLPGDLPDHQVKLLKGINAKLASGRLILAQGVGGEDNVLHAYGLSLVKQAEADLACLANGDAWLDAPTSTEPGDGKYVVSVDHHDDESLLAGFENSVLRGVPWYSRPGALP